MLSFCIYIIYYFVRRWDQLVQRYTYHLSRGSLIADRTNMWVSILTNRTDFEDIRIQMKIRSNQRKAAAGGADEYVLAAWVPNVQEVLRGVTGCVCKNSSVVRSLQNKISWDTASWCLAAWCSNYHKPAEPNPNCKPLKKKTKRTK
jgi:hypothetical protein